MQTIGRSRLYKDVIAEINSAEDLITLEETAKLLGRSVRMVLTYRKKYGLKDVNKPGIGRSILFRAADVIYFGMKHKLIIKIENDDMGDI